MAAIPSVSVVSPATLRELFVTPVLRVFEQVLEGQPEQRKQPPQGAAPVKAAIASPADQATRNAAPPTRFSTTSLALLFAGASEPAVPSTQAANDAHIDALRNALHGVSTHAPVTEAERASSSNSGSPGSLRDIGYAHTHESLVSGQSGTPKVADNTLQVGWSAHVWPGQPARVEVSKQTPTDENSAAAGAGGYTWQTRVAMRLPRLGEFEAVVTLSPQGIHMALHAGDGNATRELKENLAALRAGLGDAGLRLCQIEVHAGVQPMSAP